MTLSLSHRRCRGERGEAAIELPLAFAFVIIPVVAVVMTVSRWPEHRTVAAAAAKEAATLYANADTQAAGADLARQAVQQAAVNHGLDGYLTVEFAGDWCRACTVTARVTVTVPAVDMPMIGSVGSFTWSTESTARIDDYRSFAEPPVDQP